jgi:hypothetical protein
MWVALGQASGAIIHEARFAAKVYLLAAVMGASVGLVGARLGYPLVTVHVPSPVSDEPSQLRIFDPTGPTRPDPNSKELNGIISRVDDLVSELRLKVYQNDLLLQDLNRRMATPHEARVVSEMEHQLISLIRIQMEATNPNGPFARTLWELKERSLQLSLKAQSEKDRVTAYRFELAAGKFQAISDEVDKLHGDALALINELRTRNERDRLLSAKRELLPLTAEVARLLENYRALLQRQGRLSEVSEKTKEVLVW